MSENEKSLLNLTLDMKSESSNYFLDIRTSNDHSQKVFVKNRFTIGSSPEVDFHVSEDLGPIQCIFHVENDILTLHNEAKQKSFIGRQELAQGRMYIIDKGDRIILNDKNPVTIVVGREEVALKPRTLELDIVSLEKELPEQKKIYEEKKKDKQTVLSRNKNKFVIKKSSEGVGPFTRLYALVVNVSLVYGIVHYVIPKIGLQEKWTRFILAHAVPLVEKLIKPLPPVFLAMTESFTKALTTPGLMGFFLAFVLYDLISHIMLGVSLPYFFAGIKLKDNLFVSRIKGVVRSLFGNLTFFLVVFDLPSLTGSRTFKEVITLTHFKRASRMRKTFSWLFLFPLFILVGLYSPFLNDLSLLTGGYSMEDMDEGNKEHVRVLNNPNRISNPFAVSSAFQLVLREKLPANITFVPHFETINNVPTPYLTVFDKKKRTSLDWKFEKKISLSVFLNKAGQGNPLFSAIFPLLDQRVKKKKQGDFSLDEQRELRRLFEAVLYLDGINFFSLLTKYGPFIDGYVKGKSYLMASLGPSSKRHRVNFSFSNSLFWFNIHSLEGDLLHSLMLPLVRPDGPVWSFTFKQEAKGLFQEKLLPWLQKNRQGNQVVLQKTKASNINAFTHLDFLSKKRPLPPMGELLDNLIFFYGKNITKAWRESQQELAEEWKNSLESIRPFFKSMSIDSVMQKKLDKLYQLIDKHQ